MLNKVEYKLGDDVPTILCEYPTQLGALARTKPGDPRVCERFEVYACGVELCNAFSELTDPKEQRERFQANYAERKRLYGWDDPMDEDFLAAFRKYREIQEEDPILALIKVAYNTIYKMQVHLDSINFDEVDVDGRPLYKPKDVIADLTSISKIRSELKTLEELHKTSMEAEAAVRGGVELGMLD